MPEAADPEMVAIRGLARVLDPLDRNTCNRVLMWAQKRYVDNDPLSDWDKDSMRVVSEFMEAANETARTIGMARGADLLKAMAKVADQVKADAAEETKPAILLEQ